ncbi:hypothetical protein SAMD00019534_077300 [Acytostelium subglobosum LB1]|uniref:hypothetical protein n=1 Tax=Acytostelium subglobosum LB1 TaxID=1410327 RepID=UPI000644DD47|nr:hypothetical protein SAMD00019534_077300 [Acytostelium subglobosum LB1]GAM24555.1 hypothetical protein SAMD00019534_077300 [Acytostelium subglobosum LB1]|eukprot:XP_012752224.1 hypothetical protein SAMD00019534_077300 [Acytostelium subglobosum LB1]
MFNKLKKLFNGNATNRSNTSKNNNKSTEGVNNGRRKGKNNRNGQPDIQESVTQQQQQQLDTASTSSLGVQSDAHLFESSGGDFVENENKDTNRDDDVSTPTLHQTKTGSFIRSVSSQLFRRGLKSSGSRHDQDNDNDEHDDMPQQQIIPPVNDDEESDDIYEDDGDDQDDYNEDEEEEAFIKSLQEVENELEAESQQLTFRCLSPNELVQHQQKEIKDVADLLQLSPSSALALLKHFNWKREKMLTRYFESPKDVCKEVGIEFPGRSSGGNSSRSRSPSSIGHQSHDNVVSNIGAYSSTTTTTQSHHHCADQHELEQEQGESEERVCSICGDENQDEMTSVKCRHFFCNDCWGGYLTSKINEGEANIRCPFYKCTAFVDDSIVQRLVAPVTYEKYLQFETKKFLAGNQSQVRWCPTPGCDNAITLIKDSASTTLEIVQCSCGRKFCFKCHRESHAPATCEQMSQWEAKCQDESETSHWKVVNCKQCPKCSVSVEKNGGCNHMNCRQCQYEWCWVCMRSWKGHNDFYVCNRFEKEKEPKKFLYLFNKPTASSKKRENAEIEEREKNKAELLRYLHYYERYVNNDSAKKLEKVMRDEARCKMEELEKLDSTWANVQFIEKGVDQLLECRNVLKHTYVFAFFSFSQSNQQRVETARELFEFLQQELEKSTESLAEVMEEVLKKSVNQLGSQQRIQVMNMITLTKTKTLGLINAVAKDSLFEL